MTSPMLSLGLSDFQIEDNGLLRFRASGERTNENTPGALNAFEQTMARHEVRGILADLRRAEYSMDETEFNIAQRGMARKFGPIPVAVITRNGQESQLSQATDIIQANGGTMRFFFRSYDEAEAWILEQLAP
ncbi:hypothetical protein [Maricaulis parjimensis]|uniref:hypothetical protein n=1 Tax=Maricaulis parjimensis TaxID=144023 RepID=UPI00193A848F|nr:hypothetical protein [Maricaulis parjimensis]